MQFRHFVFANIVAICVSCCAMTAQTTIRPTTNNGDFTSGTLAYDANLTTDSYASGTELAGDADNTHHWNGFASGPPSPSSLTLYVRNQFYGSGSGRLGRMFWCTTTCTGADIHTFFNVLGADSTLQTGSTSLPTTLDLTTLKVYALTSCVGGSNCTLTLQVYEIWVVAN